MNMFLQHYLENKKSTFLACILKQVYAAILESWKNYDSFQNRQTYSRRILEIDMVSVRLQLLERSKDKMKMEGFYP